MADTNLSNNTPSRLLSSTNGLRNELIARNLYTPNQIYPITEDNQVQNIVNAVSGIINVVAPFKSFNLNNTVFGRLIVQDSPLSIIGVAMLGTQFALNMQSHVAQQTFPTIKLTNLFDGNKDTRLFTKNINYSITKKQGVTNFQEFIDSMMFYNPSRNNPFKPSQTTNVNSVPSSDNPHIQNSFYIENTGSGQITFLINSLNQNIFKQGFTNSPTDKALQAAATKAEIKFTKRNTVIGSYDNPLNKYKNYYNFFDAEHNPYTIFNAIPTAIADANGDMVISMNSNQKTQEYAPSADFVENYMGYVDRNHAPTSGYQISESSNDWVNPSDEFNQTPNENRYNYPNKIIWGRNGVSDKANDELNKFRGSFNNVDKNIASNPLPNAELKAYTGLLEYTRNLLNASVGSVVDMTRKAFVNKNKNVQGFNGSSLWVVNGGTYAGDNNGKTGLRQHSAIDQYDRFAKAIRFNGNNVYQGNPNSVVYKTVLPRIHPTIDKETGKVDNKNLMFSIENLAIKVISSDAGYGIIDDEYGSAIPEAEVGPYNGRLMWFPPYDINISESTSAKFDTTVMVGRNEPMYSYMNSERSATLSFTLLVDYPQQLKDINFQGPNRHRAISEFFSFGGDPSALLSPQQNNVLRVDNLEYKKKTITGPTETAQPDDLVNREVKIVFPNDFPNEGQIKTAIDYLYSEAKYQIEPGCLDAYGKATLGINQSIFVKQNVSGDTTLPKSDPNYLQLRLPLPPGFSQYEATGTTNCDLNKFLYETYRNEINRQFYKIVITGGASKLYIEDPTSKVKKEGAYNTALGLRRAKAASELVRKRIKAMFGQFPENLGIVIEYGVNTGTGTAGSTGSLLAPISTADKEAMEEADSIQSRYATISIQRNKALPNKIVPKISEDDAKNIQKINQDIAATTKLSANQSSNAAAASVYEERGKDTDAILGGFKSISGNYFYPVFHSQTPEDFHKRLTFLQQCMRQGAAKHYNLTEDTNGIPRARNSVFGRQPICILRIGDFFHTKIIIENLTIDYSEAPWDMNPEGFGMQPMLAKITMQIKVIGGQSLAGPIDALQNAVSFNYYANSTYTNAGLYYRPSEEEKKQQTYINGILAAQPTVSTTPYGDKSNPTAKQ